MVIYKRAFLGEWEVHKFPPDRENDSFSAIYVPSDTNPEQTYTVIMEITGKLNCECKGFYYRNDCKHVAQVTEYITRLQNGKE